MGPEIVYKNNNSNLQGCIIATEYFILINSIEYSYKIMKNSNNNTYIYMCIYIYIYLFHHFPLTLNLLRPTCINLLPVNGGSLKSLP